MTSGMTIGLRAAALSCIAWAGLLNDARAQEGCNNFMECRGSGESEACAQDETTGDTHCHFGIHEGQYGCFTGSGGSCT
jgi:hypothetical protein